MNTLPDVNPEPKTLRRLGLVQSSSMFLWLPCAALSLVFFLNDRLFILTMSDASEGTALVDSYRDLARQMEGQDKFGCEHHDVPYFDDPDQRDLLIRVLERAQRESGSRRMQVGVTKYLWVVNPVEKWDLALLRRGFAIDSEHARGTSTFTSLEYDTIEPHCEAQELQRRLGQPPLPPIPAYAPARALLLEAADRMEQTLARYAAVRPWLLAFFYSWIAYSLLGFAIALYMIRLNRRLQAARRATPDAASSGTVSTATSGEKS